MAHDKASYHAKVSIRLSLAMLLGMLPALGLLITKLNVLAWTSRRLQFYLRLENFLFYTLQI